MAEERPAGRPGMAPSTSSPSAIGSPEGVRRPSKVTEGPAAGPLGLFGAAANASGFARTLRGLRERPGS